MQYVLFMREVVGGSTNKINLNKIDQIVPKLKQLGLIISCEDNRGLYYINPKYAHKGAEKLRLENLENIISERLLKELPINMLVDIPEDKLDAK